MKNEKSKLAYDEACAYVPGGVNSPVRAFQSVGCAPIFADHAQGSHITDIDGNTYIDYIGSWGPMILGHTSPILQVGLQEAIQKGISFGLPTTIEVDLAKLIIQAYPAMDMIRMVNSGTEATMSAIRVARGYTKKDKIIKFEGNYHGHNDCLLVSSGSGALTYGIPTSPGVPSDIVKNTLVCKYNDIDSVNEVINANPNEIAAIIIEPIAGNMGLVPASKSFLTELRSLCTKHSIVLIFDEVISGFRSAYGGASEIYGIQPDMACFGKIIGGGLPVGAYGGKKEIMQMVSPIGPVYQAGTLSGNPLAMHMGKTMLEYLKQHQEIYNKLENFGSKLQEGMQNILNKYDLSFKINRSGSLMTLFFTNQDIHSYDDVKTCDTKLYQKYFQGMLERGILLAPSQFEAMFISSEHTQDDLEKTLHAFDEVMKDFI